MVKERVTSRKRDADGNLIGRADANPILDTREYIVEFEDSNEAKLTANLIASAMYAQCNPDGNQYVLLRPPLRPPRSPFASYPRDGS